MSPAICPPNQGKTITPGSHPIAYNYKRAGNTNITFYPDRNNPNQTLFTGPHLGAVASGAWQWTKAPTAAMNGRGNFDSNVLYAASHHFISGGDVFFAYFGQDWINQTGSKGLANQIFHFKLDGSFVGQFGLPSFTQGTLLNAPGAAGNIFRFAAVQTNGVTYLFTNDEGGHGLHRWRIDP